MQINCIRTTFILSEGLCLDKRKDCDRLAARGDCDTFVTNMTEICPATCNRCANNGDVGKENVKLLSFKQ